MIALVTLGVTWVTAAARETRASYPAPARVELLTSAPIPVPRAPDQMSPADQRPTMGDEDQPEGELDLVGNDVMPAVARYKVDNAGSIYELHSPQTEVPHLGSPKS